MLSKSVLIALGLASFFVFALVSFPASMAYRWFAPDELSLAAMHGTVWRGGAAQGAVSGIAFSDIAWNLNPVPLITGKLDLIIDQVQIGSGSARAQIKASGNRTEITIVDLFISLQPFRESLSLGDVRGQVAARELHMELVDGWPVAASGAIRIGELAVPPLIPVAGVERVTLGNFRAEFTDSGAPGIYTLLNDEGGPLELSGTFRLTPDRQYQFDTRIRPRADAADVLVQGIELVSGPPDAQGRRSFIQTGTL